MKVIKKKKTSLYSGREREESSERSGGVASWAITDRSQFSSLAKASAAEGQRAPELWVQDGERRPVHFIDTDAIASFMVYNIKAGNRYTKYIAPPEGETDLFASTLHLRPQRMFLFRCIDIDGYVPKKGPKKGMKQTDLPRFYLIGSRQYDQIKQITDVSGQALNDGILMICRSGSGTNTVYSYIPRPHTLTGKQRQAIAKFPKWKEYYKPATVAQQRAAVAAAGGGESDDE